MKNFPNHILKGLIAAFLLVLMYSCNTGSEAETTLVITVRDHNTQQYVQGAAVTLYKTVGDFTYSTNAYRTTNTDASGQATFTGVDAGIDYYFDAAQGGKTNLGSTYHVGSTTKIRQTTYASTEIQ